MSEEELLQRAAEERASIVGRYEHGRQEGAQIDPWEDPAFEIYHSLDRYGFIHDEEVTDKPDPAEVKVEMERVKKWVKMLLHWKEVCTSDKLRRRVFKGIPNSLRGEAWSKMLNLATLREEQSGKYSEMRDLAWKWSTDIRQIDLDVNRTYRDHIMFRERYNAKQQQLFNVLGAYSVYNVEIGYCQGMSQIAALLLMYLDEEDAFWALSVLVSDRKYAMHGFFIHGFPKLLRYQEHHDKIMNKFLPKLKKHLDRNGVDTGIYTLKWFFQCFLDRIPFKLTLRVWDVYLFEGERVLTAMAYNLLKLHRRTLMRLGMDDILQFLQVRLEKKFDFDEDTTMESLQRCMDELKKSKLDYPGPPPPHELPRQPFGLFKEPAFDQKVGHRSSEFSSIEHSTRDSVVMRRDIAVAAATASPPTPTTTANGHAQRHSHGGDPVPGPQNILMSSHKTHSCCGSVTPYHSPDDFSCEPSTSHYIKKKFTSRNSTTIQPMCMKKHKKVCTNFDAFEVNKEINDNYLSSSGSKFSLDDASSLLGEGSRRSLDTSVTSTADLSVFSSSATRSQAPDTHSLCDTGDEAGSAGPSTPRASPDIVRIYVPYGPPTPSISPQNGDLNRPPLDKNKIRIVVMDQPSIQDEGQTPIVELGPPLVKNFHLDQPIVDLK